MNRYKTIPVSKDDTLETSLIEATRPYEDFVFVGEEDSDSQDDEPELTDDRQTIVPPPYNPSTDQYSHWS